MRDYRAEINGHAREVHRQAVERNTQTRPISQQLMRGISDIDLLRFMSAELLVLLIENATKRPAPIRPPDEPEPKRGRPKGSTGIPRKGTKARAQWETETDEGRAWAAAMEQIESSALDGLMTTMREATEKYANSVRLEWTSEILDRLFLDTDGSAVHWRDATAGQHEARAASLLHAAAGPVRDAILHETAARQIREAGAQSLDELVGATA